MNGAEKDLPGIPLSDPDATWREALPPEFRRIAGEYGREMFAAMMNVQAMNYFAGILGRRVAGNAELTGAVLQYVEHSNKIVQAYFVEKGWTAAQLSALAGDIQRAAALAQGGSSIILPGSVH